MFGDAGRIVGPKPRLVASCGMHDEDDDTALANPPWQEVVIGVVETVAAAVGCAFIASAPLLVGLVVLQLAGAVAALITTVALTIAIVVLPASVPMPTHPALTGYERWGRRVGTLLRAPITWRESRANRRSQRALGSSSSSSSAAAPSLGPRHR